MLVRQSAIILPPHHFVFVFSARRMCNNTIFMGFSFLMGFGVSVADILATAQIVIVYMDAQNPSSSLEELRSAAERGDAKAQSDLGWRYHHGESVPKDF